MVKLQVVFDILKVRTIRQWQQLRSTMDIHKSRDRYTVIKTKSNLVSAAPQFNTGLGLCPTVSYSKSNYTCHI